MARSLNVLLMIFALLAPVPASAQTAPSPGAPEMYELILKDGSRAFGTLERESDTEIVFRTHAGAQIIVARGEVVSLRKVRGTIDGGEFRPSDAHRSRLFFGPTGRSLEKGQVSVGVFEFLAPFVQVGVTDRFSIGGGTPLVFGFDDWDRPFWVTPKLQVIDSERFQAAVGVLHVIAANENAGIAYGVGTYGTSDKAVSVGAGLAYTDDSRGGIVMVGAERRATRHIKLITENYVWKNGEGILSGGVRFMGERVSADLALAMPLGVDSWFVFPVVNFVYVF